MYVKIRKLAYNDIVFNILQINSFHLRIACIINCYFQFNKFTLGKSFNS